MHVLRTKFHVDPVCKIGMFVSLEILLDYSWEDSGDDNDDDGGGGGYVSSHVFWISSGKVNIISGSVLLRVILC